MLWRMLGQGPRFRPYDAKAQRFYHEKTGGDNAVTPKNTLESLRERTSALVWKSARGEAAMHRW